MGAAQIGGSLHADDDDNDRGLETHQIVLLPRPSTHRADIIDTVHDVLCDAVGCPVWFATPGRMRRRHVWVLLTPRAHGANAVHVIPLDLQ